MITTLHHNNTVKISYYTLYPSRYRGKFPLYVYRHLGTVEPLYNEVLVTIFSEYNNIYEKEPRYDESAL